MAQVPARERAQGAKARRVSTFYGDEQRALQDQFDSRVLADTLEAVIVQPGIDDEAKAFIESRAFFFLSTVNHEGHPTVSHKGGAPGFVRVLDPTTLVFPSYDGNGMFLSMGNIAGDGRIGLLFIDFETPHRVRVHANATVSADDPLHGRVPRRRPHRAGHGDRLVRQLPALHQPARQRRAVEVRARRGRRRRRCPAGRRSTSCRTCCPSATAAGPPTRAAPSPSTSTPSAGRRLGLAHQPTCVDHPARADPRKRGGGGSAGG